MNSDRLNPMVIKELRQGLKSRSFLASFLGLQGLMVLSMFIYLSTASASDDLDGADAFFWFMLGLILTVFMPLRAFQALNEEIKGNTLEMLFLTRMNSWKIAFGKWCALVIQTFLLVSAVLPYLVLRYFLGTIDVAGNLQMLFNQILFSLLLISAGVGLSAWTSKLMRGLVIVGALMSLFMIPWMLIEVTLGGGGFGFSGLGWMEMLGSVVVSGVLMMLCVEYGASQIAPPAENHAVRKRSLALLIILILSLMAPFTSEPAGVFVIALLILAPVAVDAFCEPLVGIPSLYRKLKKLGGFRWLFYPGWASGFLFVTLVFFAVVLLLTFAEGEDAFVGGVMAYNILVFPVFWMRLIPPLERKPLLAYISIQALSIAFCLLMVFLDEIGFIADYIILGHFIPLLTFFVMINEDFSDVIPPLLFCVTVLFMTINFIRSRIPFQHMSRLSRGEEG